MVICACEGQKTCDSELRQWTSKSAEGYLAHQLFPKVKEEGMHWEVNWQDQESSSRKSFKSVSPDGQLNRAMLCQRIDTFSESKVT